jgi:hypothetical protein
MVSVSAQASSESGPRQLVDFDELLLRDASAMTLSPVATGGTT